MKRNGRCFAGGVVDDLGRRGEGGCGCNRHNVSVIVADEGWEEVTEHVELGKGVDGKGEVDVCSVGGGEGETAGKAGVVDYLGTKRMGCEIGSSMGMVGSEETY